MAVTARVCGVSGNTRHFNFDCLNAGLAPDGSTARAVAARRVTPEGKSSDGVDLKEKAVLRAARRGVRRAGPHMPHLPKPDMSRPADGRLMAVTGGQ